jgi:hypothetical protein
MKKEYFVNAISNLLPTCNKEAIPVWVDFAAERVDSGQFVDFVPENDSEVAIEKWLSSIYAAFYFVKRDFGENLASQICNLSLMKSCLYPYEMKSAAEYLQSGADVEKVIELAIAGEFDEGPPFFPQLKDAIEDMNNNPYANIDRQILGM